MKKLIAVLSFAMIVSAPAFANKHETHGAHGAAAHGKKAKTEAAAEGNMEGAAAEAPADAHAAPKKAH